MKTPLTLRRPIYTDTLLLVLFSVLRRLAVALCVGGCPLSSVFAQGNLTPPGAPAPTMKTLTQVEPRTPISSLPFSISTSGAYYLTQSLTGTASENGIRVAVSNVTIDLNGFDLAGPGTGSSTGIFIVSGVSNVAIRNGTIRNWGANGIDGTGNSKVRAENLRVFSNGGIGIVMGVNGEVLNCIAESNVGNGIQGLDNCLVKDSQAISTTGTNGPGISLGAAAVVTGCVARSNSGNGITVGNGATISHCTVNSNTGVAAGAAGIATGNACKIDNCTAFNNTNEGIHGGVVVAVSGCVVASSGYDGIDVGDHALIQNCHVNASGNVGIYVTNFSVVRDCTVDFSTGQFATGIFVNDGENRIEGNNVTRNPYGIYVRVAGNLIIRNSASGNTTNYFIASGNSAGSTSSDPSTAGSWANFAY